VPVPSGQYVRVQLWRPTAILLTLTTLSASCGKSSKVEPLGISVQGDRDLILVVACSKNGHAEISETSDEVRVENVSGEFIDGDCLGSVALTLEQPLATRTLVVEGKTWYDVGRDCPWGEYGPGDVDLDLCSLDP
jgi:hypothetical protein